MANTSMTLGTHWETFIKGEVDSGRYTSASEVVRDGLRELENRSKKIDTLRQHLAVGYSQAKRGEFVENVSTENVIAGAKHRAVKSA